ncbi:MAG: sigma factor-like helix-turn-helix DNA-binding protein [Oscillospiraceae bacterium]|nr:sigma factor-like helix-turn-helix DNA-binding protein [Oscillospiraceae bacterium]
MIKINLRDFYSFYKRDTYLEVSDEIAEVMRQWIRDDEAYRIRTYRAKAYYSLDRADGIEFDAVFTTQSPEELYERRLTLQQLNEALGQLPIKQSQRIYSHFILGKSKTEIAGAEGVSESSVRESIASGLRSMEKILKNL